MTETHARDVYQLMLRDTVGPALREQKFRGSRGSYYLDRATGHTGSLLISANSKLSTQQETVFSLHIGVVSRYLREFHKLAQLKSPKNAKYALDHDWMREGTRISISREADPAQVGHEVLQVVAEQALPALLASLSDEGLRRAVDGCPVGAGRGGARTLMEIEQGNFDVARRRIDDFVARAGETDASRSLRLKLAESQTQYEAAARN